MSQKYEWRKKEKHFYIPKQGPKKVDIPPFQFISLSGAGNPNSPFFGKYIEALYSVSYAIKMTLKKRDNKPDHYSDWTVYPLEGVWDISEKAKKEFSGQIDKDELVFDLMIRQPDFITHSFYEEMLAYTANKKPNELLSQLTLKTVTEGPCVQMMHVGPYDNEKETFEIMEKFAEANKLIRKSKIHREVYLSDFRKVAPEKLKTVLRFQVD